MLVWLHSKSEYLKHPSSNHLLYIIIFQVNEDNLSITGAEAPVWLLPVRHNRASPRGSVGGALLTRRGALSAAALLPPLLAGCLPFNLYLPAPTWEHKTRSSYNQATKHFPSQLNFLQTAALKGALSRFIYPSIRGRVGNSKMDLFPIIWATNVILNLNHSRC